jgi:hypothetical protein
MVRPRRQCAEVGNGRCVESCNAGCGALLAFATLPDDDGNNNNHNDRNMVIKTKRAERWMSKGEADGPPQHHHHYHHYYQQ